MVLKREMRWWRFNYLNADMRIEATMQDDVTPVDNPRTKNSKLCGQPGEYMIIPPRFFYDPSGIAKAKYGDKGMRQCHRSAAVNSKRLTISVDWKGKVILFEFARYRYGIHEEHGYPGESQESGDKFPYTFVNTKNESQITGCYNANIEGSYTDSYVSFANHFRPSFHRLIDHINLFRSGMPCSYPDNPDCRFRPNLSATTGPSTSLMFMPFIPTVIHFIYTQK